jgi:hypothetical protein
MTKSKDELYLIVAKELTVGIRDEALWMKAFALENGDEQRTKAHYIRLRVASLDEKTSNPTYSPTAHASEPMPSADDSQTNASPRRLGRSVVLVLGSLIALAAIKPFFQSLATTPPNPSSPPVERRLRVTAPTHPAEYFSAGITVDATTNSIALDGEITEKMATLFPNAIAEIRPKIGENEVLVIFLNSKGGDLYAAMRIGRAIRHDSNHAVVVMENKQCFSSCVFILAGGNQRIRRGSIGIHRPYLTSPSADTIELQRWFGKLSQDAKRYLREMNIRETLFDDMVSIPPQNIQVFKSTTEMDRYGLLEWDPVAEEELAAAQMRRFGITTKSVLYERKQKFEQECQGYADVECYERVMRGG